MMLASYLFSICKLGAPLLDSALAHIEDLKNRYFRLMLLLQAPGELPQDLAKKLDCPLVNVNLVVSEKLKSLPSKSWPSELPDIVRDIIWETNSDQLVFDRIELLFEPAMQRDPLKLLQGCSRNRSLIVHWPGEIHDGCLTYATPGHPEYRHYASVDALIIDGP